MLSPALLYVLTHIDSLALTKYTAGSHLPVWPKPGNEPLVDIERAVFVTVHHQAAVLVLTAIRPFPQWHILLVLTCMAHFGRIAFIDDRKCFPKAQTLIGKHLHKAVESPIIIHQAVAQASLVSLFTSFMLLFLDDHLPLGKIADDNSSFSQFASDEMGCFVQTVLLLLALLFRDTFVRFREMNIPMGLFLAPISLGTDFVQLFV